MRGRYSLTDHALSRAVSALVVSAAIGPWIHETRVADLDALQELGHSELLARLHEQEAAWSLFEAIGLVFAAVLVILVAIEGLSLLIRTFVIPRGPES